MAKTMIPKGVDTLQEFKTLLLQKELLDLGFSPRGLDGQYGPNTEAAFKEAYQALVHGSRGHTRAIPPAHYLAAEKWIGEYEVAGKFSNPKILGLIRLDFPWVKNDGELAWCALFVNAMLKEGGIKGTGKAAARSYLKWGCSVRYPKKGDVVIFERGKKSWQGHVAFYVRETRSHIYVLGGNQSNGVNIKPYPKSKLLGIRRAVT